MLFGAKFRYHLQNFAIICKISLLAAKFCSYMRLWESDKKPCRYFVLSKQKVET